MHTCWPPNVPACLGRPYGLIHLSTATARTHRGGHYRLDWTRLLIDDGDVTDVLTQTHTTADGDRTRTEIGHFWDRTRAAAQFADLADLYRAITEQADGIPAPGQLALNLT